MKDQVSAPFSPAADRNKEPILNVLNETLSESDKGVMELGSGTGQHGIYFAKKLPGVTWTFTDVEVNHQGIRSNIALSGIENYQGPVSFEVGKDEFPQGDFDLFYTANTFHIMSWKLVKTFIKGLGKSAKPGARFLVYGPFFYSGKSSAPSNLAFDRSLKERNPSSGIRNFEDVKSQVEKRDFRLVKDYEMPANNRALVFIKI